MWIGLRASNIVNAWALVKLPFASRVLVVALPEEAFLAAMHRPEMTGESAPQPPRATSDDTPSVPRQSAWRSTGLAWLRAMRPQHWVKNLLVFVPLLLSHQVLDRTLLARSVIAFVAFCLCASAAYLVNDLSDVEADRRHPLKQFRPFAAQQLSVAWGLPLAMGLLLGGVTIGAVWLPAGFAIALLTYVLLTSLYTAWLKRWIVVDALTLAALYGLRIIGGGLATGIPVSKWLLAFSTFLFLSLAFAKRCAELRRLATQREDKTRGRGYLVHDLSLLEWIGPANGYLAGLVFALYIESGTMAALYRNPLPLWLICPLYFYWITRLWRKAWRGDLLEDPVVFVVRDPVSLAISVAVLGLMAWATIG